MDFGDSTGAVHGLFQILDWVLFPFAMTSLITGVFFYRSVPGTRARYVWRTFDKIAICFSFTWWLVGAIRHGLDDERGWVIVCIVNAVLNVWFYQQRHRDDEDDWFKGLGGRIKRRLAARRRGLATA